jgi:hypothetical protein
MKYRIGMATLALKKKRKLEFWKECREEYMEGKAV